MSRWVGSRVVGFILFGVVGLGPSMVCVAEQEAASASSGGPKAFGKNVEIVLTVESKEVKKQVSFVAAMPQSGSVETKDREGTDQVNLSFRGDVLSGDRGVYLLRYHISWNNPKEERAPLLVMLDGSALLEPKRSVVVGRSGELVFKLAASERD